MTDTAPTPTSARLADNARRVAPFQWKLLAVFLVIGLVGAGVYAFAYFNHSPSAGPNAAGGVHSTAGVTPRGASGFLGKTTDTPVDNSDAAPAASTGRVSDTWAGWTGEKGAALGFGFAGGFILGFVFRAFLKLMMLITILVVGGLAALSYFHVLNIDFTAARTTYENNAAWLTDQAMRLKDVLMAHLPGSSTGAVGAFFGLRRR